VGFVVDEFTLEQIFLRVLQFPPPNPNSTIVPYSSPPEVCVRSHHAAHYHILALYFGCFISVLVLRRSRSNKIKFRVSLDGVDVTYSMDTVMRDVTPCSPVEVYPTFSKNVLHPSSVLKSKSHKQQEGWTCWLLDLHEFLPDYTASKARR
jgi:hypothetical protein